MGPEPNIDQLVEQVHEGHEDALEAIIKALQKRIYNLALPIICLPPASGVLKQSHFPTTSSGMQTYIDYDLIYLYNDMLFNGSKNVDGRAFDKPENRPTNLQIPLVRHKA